jgi:hypothetical protein
VGLNIMVLGGAKEASRSALVVVHRHVFLPVVGQHLSRQPLLLPVRQR